MVSANAFPSVGGTETHIHEVSTRLAAAGVDVTVLTTDRAGDMPVDEMFSGYRVRRWSAYPRSRDYYLAPGLARHLLRSEDYDVVHVQGVTSLIAPVALAATRQAGIPTVLTFHGGGNGGHPSRLRNSLRPVQRRLLARLLRTSAALVAVSEDERRLFAPILGDMSGTIHLIPNGCDALPIDHAAEVPQGSPLLVSVGRLVRSKGHHRVLAALPAILARAPDARLVIAGRGPDEQQLRETARRLGVGDRVSVCFFGPERRAVLGQLMATADVFCLLSQYESQAVAVLEALGVGTKALVSDIPAHSELGRAGIVTTIALDAPPERIATAVLAVAAAPPPPPPDLPSWDVCVEQLHRLYEEVTA